MKKGVQKVNIQEIAKQANVSQVTIYNYYGSKEKLLVEVIRPMLDDLNTQFHALLESKKPFFKKVETLIQIREMNEDVLAEILSENKELRDLYNRYAADQALSFFKAFIEQGKAEVAVQRFFRLTAFFLRNRIFK